MGSAPAPADAGKGSSRAESVGKKGERKKGAEKGGRRSSPPDRDGNVGNGEQQLDRSTHGAASRRPRGRQPAAGVTGRPSVEWRRRGDGLAARSAWASCGSVVAHPLAIPVGKDFRLPLLTRFPSPPPFKPLPSAPYSRRRTPPLLPCAPDSASAPLLSPPSPSPPTRLAPVPFAAPGRRRAARVSALPPTRITHAVRRASHVGAPRRFFPCPPSHMASGGGGCGDRGGSRGGGSGGGGGGRRGYRCPPGHDPRGDRHSPRQRAAPPPPQFRRRRSTGMRRVPYGNGDHPPHQCQPVAQGGGDAEGAIAAAAARR